MFDAQVHARITTGADNENDGLKFEVIILVRCFSSINLSH